MNRVERIEPIRSAADSSPEDVAFVRIADSAVFRAAPVLRTLLLYLWEHRSESLSEYAIAVDALGRRSEFDPRLDASVRVQIARLRARLKEFYDGEGERCPLRVSIPRGGHQLEFVYSPAGPIESIAEPNGALNANTGRENFRTLWLLTAASAVLAGLCLWLFVENRDLKAATPAAASPLPRFWRSFLNGDKPVAVVVPAPIHHAWPKQRLSVREKGLTDFEEWSKSPALLELARLFGPPELEQGYVVATHLFPAVKLIQYLDRRGIQAQLVVSPRLSMDSYSNSNTVLMGGPINTRRFQTVLSGRNFEIVETNPILIRNVNPKPDEPHEYRESAVSNQHIEFPGIVGLSPKSPEGTATLVLIARRPDALVSMLLSAEGLKRLDHHWNQHGKPAAWEMVVQAEMNGETVLNVRPVSFRPVK
jgi:hypothetical protein